MNESRQSIDDLFKKGLENHSMDAPLHVWEKIDSTRTPLYKLINGFKQNSRWYLSVFAGLTLLSTVTFAILSTNEPAPQLATLPGGTESTSTAKTAPAYENTNAAYDNTVTSPVADETNTAPSTHNGSVKSSIAADRPVSYSSSPSVPAIKVSGTTRPTGIISDITPEMPDNEIPANSIVVANDKLPAGFMTRRSDGGFFAINPDFSAPDFKTTTASKETIAKETNKYRSLWSLELVASYDFVNKSIESNNAAYVALRKNSEKINSAFTLQGRVGYRMSDLFSVKTGISYSAINESISLNQAYTYQSVEDRTYTGIIVDPIKGPQPYTYTVRDTFQRTGQHAVSSNNTYTFIDIPLTLNYHLYESRKWNLQLGAGALFNLKFAQSGMFINPANNEATPIANNSPFVASTQVNFVFNAGLSYRICQNTDLLIEPSVRTNNSVFKSGFEAKQTFTTYSLFTGIRYRF